MLREMLHPRRVKSATWLVAVLVILLVLGHVCELPAFTDVTAHAAGSNHHHQADHRSDDSRVSCDIVDATHTTHTDVGVAQPVAIGSVSGPVAMGGTGVVARGSTAPLSRSRPRLFLLHSTLLI